MHFGSLIYCYVFFVSGVFQAQLRKMPMDHYVQQSQKSNLWARRRNNTANKLLQGHLKHLERGYAKDYRQYLRDKLRLQCELMELEDIPSKLDSNTSTEWDLNDTENEDAIISSSDQRFKEISFTNQTQQNSKSRRVMSQSPRRPATSNQSSKTECLQVSDSFSQNITQDTLPETRQTPAKLLNTSSEIVSLSRPNSSFSVTSSAQNIPHSSSHITSIPSESLGRLKRGYTFGPGDVPSRNLNSSPTESLCRYSPDHSLNSLCNHFPCTVPITYHTLGFRREDLCPWTSELEAGAQDHNWNSNVGHLPRSRNSLLERNQDRLDTARNRNLSIERNTSQHEQRYQFRRVHGPLFSPKPRDPILEGIRSGSVKSLPTPPSTARVTVKEKIRGLKQLISEMKARNEKTKPVDWAVNYGQRLPTRMLLNPVVPISD